MSIRYSDGLTDAGIKPSVGSTGDSCDNALTETIKGLYKTELIRRRSPWKSLGFKCPDELFLPDTFNADKYYRLLVVLHT